MPATASSAAATEPTFLLPAPVKPDAVAEPDEPVFVGTTGVIGEPVAPEPEPEPKPDPDPEAPDAEGAEVPVAMGAVPVRKPEEPTADAELSPSLFQSLIMQMARNRSRRGLTRS